MNIELKDILHYGVICLKCVATIVMVYFTFTLYYGMYRYKTDVEIRKKSQYSLLNPKYALTPTIVITVFVFGVLYLFWKVL